MTRGRVICTDAEPKSAKEQEFYFCPPSLLTWPGEDPTGIDGMPNSVVCPAGSSNGAKDSIAGLEAVGCVSERISRERPWHPAPPRVPRASAGAPPRRFVWCSEDPTDRHRRHGESWGVLSRKQPWGQGQRCGPRCCFSERISREPPRLSAPPRAPRASSGAPPRRFIVWRSKDPTDTDGMSNDAVRPSGSKPGTKGSAASLKEVGCSSAARVHLHQEVGADVSTRSLSSRGIIAVAQEASEKAYCDEEMAKIEAKNGELENMHANMTSKIDQFKEEVHALECKLSAIFREQSDTDKVGEETHEAYVVAKRGLEQGFVGVHSALCVLRDHHNAKVGASFVQRPPVPAKHIKVAGIGQPIIDVLEGRFQKFGSLKMMTISSCASAATLVASVPLRCEVTHPGRVMLTFEGVDDQ